MKRLLCIAAIAATTVLPFAAATVHASTVDDCQAQITALSAATAATTFDRDKQGLKLQEQLIHHCDQGAKTLSLGNLRDAKSQFSDYLTDLEKGVESGKLTADAAAPLATAAQGVIDCIDSIQ